MLMLHENQHEKKITKIFLYRKWTENTEKNKISQNCYSSEVKSIEGISAKKKGFSFLVHFSTINFDCYSHEQQ
jgi:hypothetical protein